MTTLFSLILFINDKLIGSINKENVLVFDMKPGEYEFLWKNRTTDIAEQNSVPEKLLIKLEAGQSTVIRGNYHLTAGTMFFGLIGALISPPYTSIEITGREEVTNKIVVISKNCDLTICM